MGRTDSALAANISLPPDYRASDVLRFHGRDKEAFAEVVEGNVIRKAVMINGMASVFEATLASGVARCRLLVDGKHESTAFNVEVIGRRLLGLSIDASPFEAIMRDHPLLSQLLASQSGLLIPQVATPFEALTWAITGQQINLAVAMTLRRRLIALTAIRHSTGLYCYPDASSLVTLTPDQLGEAKFSRAKARTLLLASEMVQAGTLPLDDWLNGHADIETVRERLLAIPGVGPWTANYTLLRGFGFADCSLHGDAAVKNALRVLLGQEAKITNEQAQAWMAPFSPWRSLVAAHLWESRRISA